MQSDGSSFGGDVVFIASSYEDIILKHIYKKKIGLLLRRFKFKKKEMHKKKNNKIVQLSQELIKMGFSAFKKCKYAFS